jgi:hypothetical protein
VAPPLSLTQRTNLTERSGNLGRNFVSTTASPELPKLCARPDLVPRSSRPECCIQESDSGGVVQTWSGAMRIYKLATHDGNYTVYRDGEVLCCGLTRTTADALITQIAAAYARYH